jgi:hypothetical protein
MGKPHTGFAGPRRHETGAHQGRRQLANSPCPRSGRHLAEFVPDPRLFLRLGCHSALATLPFFLIGERDAPLCFESGLFPQPLEPRKTHFSTEFITQIFSLLQLTPEKPQRQKNRRLQKIAFFFAASSS